MSQIAFIGLGHMGRPMAENLVKKGHHLRVFDLVASQVDALAAAGAIACKTAQDTITGAEFVISMLPASQHVEGLYLGDSGLLAKIPAGALVIDCSTIAPDSAKKVATEASKRGLKMIDAPVSGGTAGAAAGTLSFIVGGDKNNFETALPVLQCMGKNIFHAGPSGMGQVAKVCNNMLLAIHMIGTAEALNLGVASGIDPKILSEIMLKSSGGNWSLEKYNPYPGVMDGVPASRGFEGGFGVDLMAKDLGLANEAATTTRTATPMGSLARSLYASWSAHGKGKLDFSSIVEFLKPKS